MTILTCRIDMQPMQVGDMIQLALVPAGSRIGLVHEDPFSHTLNVEIEQSEYVGDQEIIGLEILAHGDWRETHWPHSSGAREYLGYNIIPLTPMKTNVPVLEFQKRRISLLDIPPA